MKGYHISIFRHGITDANENGIYIGKTDLPLSEAGREALMDKYEQLDYPKVQRVYSSPLERAVQTAEIIFPEREIVIVDDLREMDFGVFEGLPAEELVRLDSFKKWLKGGLDNPPPNGETLRSMMLRCYSALNLMILDMMKEGFTHAGVVTHSGILMNMLSCFGLPKKKPMEFSCEPGEGYEILVTAMMWQNSSAFEILGKVPYNDRDGD
ncbi:MAG: histidine phosphatase family protein [Oscillospiraceae bacterium]|jgi:alpha-ribazole phosphatase|nr:histidine phosphatase family protein [Oscillospiraceae bacterium]